jgi:hypothetical protein
MLWIGGGSGSNYSEIYDYSESASYSMKLHIEYTEASTAASLLEGNLIRGGILLHGILGR